MTLSNLSLGVVEEEADKHQSHFKTNQPKNYYTLLVLIRVVAMVINDHDIE